MRVLIIEDSPEIIDAVSLCINLTWPEAEGFSSVAGGRLERITDSSSVLFRQVLGDDPSATEG